MKCKVCGGELVFVKDCADKNNIGGRTRIRVFHSPVNVQDRDTFSAGATIVEPSLTTQYRLRRELEENHDD